MSADSNLLLGVLALQMDFISREQLIAAVGAWVLDKNQSLDAVLVQQKVIKPSTRQVLNALVQEHLDQHEGDPEKSLAAVSSLRSVRQELEQLADPDVQASLQHMSVDRAERGAAEFATRTPSVGVSTSSGTRFRILRPHARGGLGEVFVANDEELPREVALKQIQDRHADQADARARFLLEAEITGGLEHPGIVPVYGLGSYGDGRPYYAMRFIRGDSLKEAIARFHQLDSASRDPGERMLALRKLLGRFIDVCNAMAYAHSRGVLHRDLKPGNIMLGKYGETLVVDWGLAKPLGADESQRPAEERPLTPTSSGSSATQMGTVVGTPAYMSPEQAAGRLDQLGPASDVYSLGATLYCLLTGQPPVTDRDVGEVLRNVQRGEFPRPTQVKKGMPRPLEAICLKAMALSPADRYASARALADDIEHWLADEPVSAAPETFGQRSARWARRNRKAVQAGAAALCAVTLVAILAAFAINGARQTAEEQREIADTQRQQAEAAQQRADQNAKLADERRELADSRLQVALEAYKSLVFDVQEQLAHRPGTQTLRKQLLETAQKGLSKLVPETERSSVADRTTIWAHLRMGDVFFKAGETQKSAKQFDLALKLAQAAVKADPADKDAQDSLAVCYQCVGDAKWQMGQVAASQKDHEQALAILQALAERHPEDAQVQRNLAASFDRVGPYVLAEDAAASRKFYDRALEIRRRLAEQDPQNADAQYALSVSYETSGDVSLYLKDAAAALKAYRDSQAICQKLAKRDPDDPAAQRAISVTHNKLGGAYLALEDIDAAEREYQAGLVIARRLAELDPEDTAAQRDLSVAFDNMSAIRKRRGDLHGARKSLEEGLAITRRLAARDPENTSAQREVTLSLDAVGRINCEIPDWPAAREALQESLDLRLKLAERDPDNIWTGTDLIFNYDGLGDVELARWECNSAIEWYKKTLAALDEAERGGKLAEQRRFAGIREATERKLRHAETCVKGAEDLDFALKQGESLVPTLLCLRMIHLTKQGRHPEAAEVARRLETIESTDVYAAYNAACAAARCRSLVGADAPKTELSDEELGLQARWEAMGLQFLRRAQADNYFADPKNLAWLQLDPDLDPLRQRPEFQAWLQELLAASKPPGPDSPPVIDGEPADAAGGPAGESSR